MAKLRALIILLTLWVIFLLNIERIDVLGINIPTTLYVAAAITLLPALVLPVTAQLRYEYMLFPVLVIYIGIRLLGVVSPIEATFSALMTESFILAITLWFGRKLSVNVERIERVVDDVVFEDSSERILSMIDGEKAVNDELFRAQRFDRPVAVMFIKMPSLGRLRRIYPNTFQYQLSLEQRYYKARIARIVESMIYRVDVMIWHGDNLIVCLPETDLKQAEKLAREISEILRSSVVLKVPMGIATYPDNGLIYSDLVKAAEDNLKTYLSDNQSEQDEDADGNLPEAADDPMTVTLPERPDRAPARISALQKLSDLMHVPMTFFMGDIKLMPQRPSLLRRDGMEKEYYDPDHWINQLSHQSSTARYMYRYIKRALDVGLILLGLPVLLPIGLIVALAIKLHDGGSIFYTQQRTGFGGHQFKMYKFRSMVPDADKRLRELGVTVNKRGETIDANGDKLQYDPRITPIGRFIRKTSLDELPQLWNVFIGDMSLVGPRPTSFNLQSYESHHQQRLSVKPGITGLWQIHDRGDTDFDNRLVWDIKYIDKFSLMMDLNILLRTVTVVFKGKGGR